MRIQSLAIMNSGVQITFLEEADVDENTGIMEARTVDIPHAVLPQPLLNDLIDSCEQIIEHARVLRRQPIEQFRAPR